MSSMAVFLLSGFLLVPPALAHDGHAPHGPETCLLGLLCGPAAVAGSWILTGFGLLLWLAGFLPYRAPEEMPGKALSLFRELQARTGKEAAGWRRNFWPLFGVALIGLGAATLLGWL